MSKKSCTDCDACDCVESEYGETIYPRAKASSIVKGFEVGDKVRNPTANTEGTITEKRYSEVVVRVTKHMIRPMGASVAEERKADFTVIYDPKYLVKL